MTETISHNTLEALLNDFQLEDSVKDIRSTFNVTQLKMHDPASLAKATALIRKIETLNRQGGTNKWFTADSGYDISQLPKHKAFFDAGSEFAERLAMSANRTGKSIMGCYEMACHLTGEYPSWWAGRRFDHAIDAWAVGPDARAVRDTIQKELMGPVGEWGTGMLPAHTLGKYFALQGTPQAIDVIMVKHKCGDWSRLGFKNYQQELKSFMGTARHVIWCDEEVPMDVYNECNIRTATTKGIMICTFTPLEGLTPMVVNFCSKAKFLLGAKPILKVETGEHAVGRTINKAVLQIGWDDAPWLTEDVKERLLDDTPEHLKEARSKGTPAMGAGNVYTTPIEKILCDPFVIPESWPRMYALDVGWNRTAAMWGALDPNSDTIYLYDEHYLGQELPSVHAHAIRARGKWIVGVIDPASRGRSQTDGTQLIRSYRDLELELFPAKNDVESGIHQMQQRLATGRLKVFKTCTNWSQEYLIYRRDKNGKVLKENDHALDCSRYVVLNQHRMSSKAEALNTGVSTYAPTHYRV